VPDQTSVYALPFPVLTDPPNVPSDMQALAVATEAALVADTRPVGDSSNSLYLTGSDVAFGSGDNHNILTTSITLLRDQWVILSGRASFDNTSSNAPSIGIYIDLGSGTPIPELTSGNHALQANGNFGQRRQLVVGPHSVFFTAGTYTVRLRGDRDNTSATVNARATDSQNVTSHPCFLSIIV